MPANTRAAHTRTDPRTGKKIQVRETQMHAKPVPPPAEFLAAAKSTTATMVRPDPFAVDNPVEFNRDRLHRLERKSAAEWQREGAQLRREANRIIENATAAIKDSPGGVSQMVANQSSMLKAKLANAQASIADGAGTAVFPGLYAAGGKRLNASVQQLAQGEKVWAVFKDTDVDQSGQPTRIIAFDAPASGSTPVVVKAERVAAGARLAPKPTRSGAPELVIEVYRKDAGAVLRNGGLASS